MSNEQIIDNFFQTEVGAKLQQDSVDESISERRMLQAEILKQDKIMASILADGTMKKQESVLKSAQDVVKVELKKTLEMRYHADREYNLCERKQRSLKKEFEAAAPSWIWEQYLKLTERRKFIAVGNAKQKKLDALTEIFKSFKNNVIPCAEMQEEIHRIKPLYDAALDESEPGIPSGGYSLPI